MPEKIVKSRPNTRPRNAVWIAKTGRYCPKHLLCSRCNYNRLNEKLGLCSRCHAEINSGHFLENYCERCGSKNIYKNTGRCLDCTKQILRDQFIEQAEHRLAKLIPKKNKRPLFRPLPKRWHSYTCWNCDRKKGSMIPIVSPLCVQCYIHRCSDPDCNKPAMYVADNEWLSYCEEHHNERKYCRVCGEEKLYSGMEYCSYCSDKFHRWKLNILARFWGRTGFECKRCGVEPRAGSSNYCRQCLQQKEQDGHPT